MFEDKRKVIEKSPHDVVVVGGGIGGIAAAVAASRNGASVLLLEKSIVLGGLATAGLISWYEPLCDGAGTQLVYGIGEELIRLTAKYGFDSIDPAWRDKTGEPTKRRYTSRFSPTMFALTMDEYIKENNVDIMLDSHAVYPVMQDKICLGVMVESKSGREYYPAKIVIDATGDAEIADRAGVPTVTGKNFMSLVAHYTSLKLARDFAENEDIVKFRKWLWVGANASGEGHPEGMGRLSGVTSEEITEYVLAGREMLLEKLKEEPRFQRDIMMLPFMPQFRTIRRIEGKTLFRGIHNEQFDDNVGAFGDFRKSGVHLQLPYSSLYNESFPNILTAGRIISAEEGDGWESIRVIPVCALSGQAAGTAAALCVKYKCGVGDIDVSKLQSKLDSDGVNIK